jgi:hypothetical protein
MDTRRKRLRELAEVAEVDASASLVLGLKALETAAGFKVAGVRQDGERIRVELERSGSRPLSHAELLERISRERDAGASFLDIAHGLERQGVPAPRGGADWHTSTVWRFHSAAGNGG